MSMRNSIIIIIVTFNTSLGWLELILSHRTSSRTARSITSACFTPVWVYASAHQSRCSSHPFLLRLTHVGSRSLQRCCFVFSELLCPPVFVWVWSLPRPSCFLPTCASSASLAPPWFSSSFVFLLLHLILLPWVSPPTPPTPPALHSLIRVIWIWAKSGSVICFHCLSLCCCTRVNKVILTGVFYLWVQMRLVLRHVDLYNSEGNLQN